MRLDNKHAEIAGVAYDLIFADCPTDLGANLGALNYDQAEITINISIPEDRQRQVMLHELLHAADVVTSDQDSERLTENQTWRITTQLFAILQNNPHLVSWLFPKQVM